MATLSSPLRRLLENELDSFEKLELALQLLACRREMSIEELALALQIGPDVMRRVAADVARTSLISLDLARDVAELRGTEEDRRALDEAAVLYERDRVGLLKVMSRIAMDRLRGMAPRTFADAFQIRRKKNGDDR